MMYIIVKETGTDACLTKAGIFLTKRNAYAICEAYNARNKNSNVCYIVKSISMELTRVWKIRKEERRRKRRQRRYNRLISKRNNVDKKIRKMQKGA